MRFGRYTNCDECGSLIYEGDYIRHYHNETYCKHCWRELLKFELYNNYIPEHEEELLKQVEEEL